MTIPKYKSALIELLIGSNDKNFDLQMYEKIRVHHVAYLHEFLLYIYKICLFVLFGH